MSDAGLTPLEVLFELPGEELPLPGDLARLYGPLRLELPGGRPLVWANFVGEIDAHRRLFLSDDAPSMIVTTARGAANLSASGLPAHVELAVLGHEGWVGARAILDAVDRLRRSEIILVEGGAGHNAIGRGALSVRGGAAFPDTCCDDDITLSDAATTSAVSDGRLSSSSCPRHAAARVLSCSPSSSSPLTWDLNASRRSMLPIPSSIEPMYSPSSRSSFCRLRRSIPTIDNTR